MPLPDRRRKTRSGVKTNGKGVTEPVVLFSAQKNEGPFLLEWIAYHKVVGFDLIVIASNDCTDGSDVLLDALAEAGEIVHLHNVVPSGVAAQTAAATMVKTSGVIPFGSWVMWLDSDEYLLPSPPAKTVKALIRSVPNADALSVAWRLCGDSGFASWPGRQISGAFTKAEPRHRSRPRQVKTLFKYDERIERLDIHRPVLREGETPQSFNWIAGNGDVVPDDFFKPTRRNPFNRILNTDRVFRMAQVLHFSIRTPDMFARKARRGDGYFPSEADPVVRDQRFYDHKNKNDVEERGALSYFFEVTQEMQRIVMNPDVRGALARVEGFDLDRMGLTLHDATVIKD